ncbi:hypothetical protein [Nocardia sp. NPDC127526]|uniref:hypothetical protein n=1 Tax=Nocardia sp. NPDC127526 TaxID=3345393 RepID=UPI00363BFB11
MDSILYWNSVALEANRVSHSNGAGEQTGPPLSARAHRGADADRPVLDLRRRQRHRHPTTALQPDRAQSGRPSSPTNPTAPPGTTPAPCARVTSAPSPTGCCR